MAKETVLIEILGKDKFSAVGRSITKSLGGIGKAAAGIAVGGLVASTAAAAGLGAVLTSLGSDAEEMLGKFDVVFGDMADDVTKQLTAFGDEVGRSKFELMEMASTVQDTFVPLGFARDQAADMSVELTKLATDVASFNNAQDPDVMRDFQSAIVGNYETVRKYGIVLNEAAVEAEAMRLGLASTTVDADKLANAESKLSIVTQEYNEVVAEHGEESLQAQKALLKLQKAEKALEKAATGTTDKLDAQVKAQAVLSLITEGSTDALGDAARTSDSWANQMRRVKSIVKDTATEIGLKLLPVVTPLLKQFGDFLVKIAPGVIAGFERIVAVVQEKVVPAFSQFIQGFLIPFAQRIGMLITTMLPGLGGLFGSLGDFIKKAMLAVQGFAAQAIPALLLFVRNTVVPFMQQAINAFGRFAQFLITQVAPVVIGFIQNTLLPLFRELVDFISTKVIPAFLLFVQETLGPLALKLWELAQEAFPKILEAFNTVITFIRDEAAPAVADFVENKIKPMIQSIKEWIAELKERAGPIVADFKQQLSETLGPAMVIISEAGMEIANAFQLGGVRMKNAGKEASGLDAILWLLKAALDGIVLGVKLAAILFWGMARAITDIRKAIDKVIRKYHDLKETLKDLKDAVPPWLRSHSPTPMEMGLRGISDAMRNVNAEFGSVRIGGGAGGAGAGVGRTNIVNVELTYSPALALGNRYEAETVLAPFIEGAVRRSLELRGVI